jgi:hypothetical protein
MKARTYFVPHQNELELKQCKKRCFQIASVFCNDICRWHGGIKFYAMMKHIPAYMTSALKKIGKN